MPSRPTEIATGVADPGGYYGRPGRVQRASLLAHFELARLGGCWCEVESDHLPGRRVETENLVIGQQVWRHQRRAMLPLTWLIFRTRPGGAGGGPGAPGVETLMMLPAVTNSPLIPARDCTRNAPVTMTLELLLLEVPTVVPELVVVVVLLLPPLLLPLLLLRLFIPTSPVVRPEGSSRSWICVSGPTELRFR